MTMPPKRTIESFITVASERSCQHIKNETAANEEGGVIKFFWGGGMIKMECPILFSVATNKFSIVISHGWMSTSDI